MPTRSGSKDNRHIGGRHGQPAPLYPDRPPGGQEGSPSYPVRPERRAAWPPDSWSRNIGYTRLTPPINPPKSHQEDDRDNDSYTHHSTLPFALANSRLTRPRT